MAKYVYPAIIRPDGDLFAVYFPDIAQATTSGDSIEDALEMAEDALSCALFDLEDEREQIPTATPIADVVGAVDGKTDIVTLIKADTVEYRKKIGSAAVKKTLTIPSWLNHEAEKAGINFSGVLQDALKEKLGVG